MSFVKEFIHNIYKKYATVDTLRTVMTIVTPLLLLKEQIVSYVKSFIPSHIQCIVHFDTDEGTITERYIAYKKGYSMTNILYEIMDLPKDGYYMIVVWNNLKQTNEHFILQANLIESALEIRNIYNLWMLQEFAISIMLSNFITYSNLQEKKIMGITVNNKDVTKILKPYLKCLSIPNNVRPNILYMLSQYLSYQKIDQIELTQSKCTYMNDEMEEVHIEEANKYILSPSVKSHPLCIVRPSLYQYNEEKKENEDNFYKEEDGDNEVETDYADGADYKNNILYSDSEIEEIFEKEANLKRRKINDDVNDIVQDENGNVYTKDATI